jgi:23S rRNA pseudouridine1911/1915/1917 synthase
VRLDLAVAARFNISRRKARAQIADGRVLVNRRRVAVASREVNANDELSIISEDAPHANVLASTERWLAVDKPPGLPTQPMRDRSHTSLEDILRGQFGTIYLVHRIDTPTSGVVIFARTKEAAAQLSSLFAAGEISKTYVAVAEGEIDREMTIDAPIEGKPALTIVRPLRRAMFGTLVEIDLKSGRTHQIRIHLSSVGHAVAGDRRYGSTIDAPRLMLHAFRLQHAEIGTIESPIPTDFV